MSKSEKKKKRKTKSVTTHHEPEPIPADVERDNDGNAVLPDGYVLCVHRRKGQMMQKLATVSKEEV